MHHDGVDDEAVADRKPRTVGPFTLLRMLGEGGMGRVYLGRAPDGGLAAVKVIRADLAADREFRARFRQEVEMASRVRSRRTVPVLGADPHGPAPWLATEYVPAPSLRDAVARNGPLPADALRTLGIGLAEALTAIHAAGVVHRDLKPANVLLADDGPRVIDFGIARAADATVLTRTGSVVGTPGFIAPEQVEHGTAGPASDVFALGGLLLHAATGRLPFGEGGAAVVLYRVLHTDPDLRGVPPVLAPVVAACLQRDPARRPDPQAVAAVLAGRAPGPGTARTIRPLDVPAPPPPAPAPRRRRRRGFVATTAVAVLALLVGLAVYLRPGSGTSDGAAPTTSAQPTAPTPSGPTQRAGPPPENIVTPPPPPAPDQEYIVYADTTGFTSPTGNIACLVRADGARCDIREKDWGDTEPGRPPSCPLAYGDALEVSGSGRGDFVCHGDTVFGNPTLPYGRSIQVGDATCHSRENGVECLLLSTRHGFTMSRSGYSVF